jgi:hypothetical protein
MVFASPTFSVRNTVNKPKYLAIAMGYSPHAIRTGIIESSVQTTII